MGKLLDETAQQYGRFLVLDIHSYNHRREGPGKSPADPEQNPQVNVGTGTMDRGRWAAVIDTFVDTLRSFDFPGGTLEVRENVKFRGGNWPRWIHENYPDNGVAIAIEFKKFFMDEWSGEPAMDHIETIGKALQSTAPAVLGALQAL
jgi:N-formylglutamate amidohydrolase